MSESPAVAAFIEQRQLAVLARGIDALVSAKCADLPEQVHRLVGTFGTYQLDYASAALGPLNELLHAENPSESDVEKERALVIGLLREALLSRKAQV